MSNQGTRRRQDSDIPAQSREQKYNGDNLELTK